MAHKPVRRDPRHHVISVVNVLSSLIAKRERQSLDDLVWRRGAEAGCFGHDGTIRDSGERSKNITAMPGGSEGGCGQLAGQT